MMFPLLGWLVEWQGKAFTPMSLGPCAIGIVRTLSALNVSFIARASFEMTVPMTMVIFFLRTMRFNAWLHARVDLNNYARLRGLPQFEVATNQSIFG
jgi:hypothetical protein